MNTAARRRPAVAIALAATLLTAFLVIGGPLSASAHDALTASSPEVDSTVDVLPAEITLSFNAELIDGAGATEVVVTDPTGASVAVGPSTVTGTTVTQPLVAAGPAGAYRVIWKIVSSDGHPTSGEFAFTVANSDVVGATVPPTTNPTSPAEEESIAPSASASPEQASAGDQSSTGPSWIWIVVIAGILAIAVAAVVAVALKGRGQGSDDTVDDPSSADSDPSAER